MKMALLPSDTSMESVAHWYICSGGKSQSRGGKPTYFLFFQICNWSSISTFTKVVGDRSWKNPFTYVSCEVSFHGPIYLSLLSTNVYECSRYSGS